MYLPVPGFESTSSEFLGKCVIRWATAAVAIGTNWRHFYCLVELNVAFNRL